MDMEIGGRRKPKTRPLSEPEWIALLEALDPDREQAAAKYETAHMGLIKIFRSRGLSKDAEDLADETVDRSARRLLEKASTDEPILNIVAYMQAVASRIASEAHRRTRQVSLGDAPEPKVHPQGHEMDDTESEDRKLDCLCTLLEELPKRDRRTILEYYRYAKSEKIASRACLARGTDKSKGALRVHVFRIRCSLREKLLKLICENQTSADQPNTAGR
jgi:DNA-directed RNA polymerase specialized sigma24 family protein